MKPFSITLIPMADEKEPVIEYLNPETIRQNRGSKQPSSWHFVLLVTIAFVDFASLLMIPRGTLYFGHRRQWIIASDSQGLMIGPYDHALDLNNAALYLLLFVLIGCIYWVGKIIWRMNKKRLLGEIKHDPEPPTEAVKPDRPPEDTGS